MNLDTIRLDLNRTIAAYKACASALLRNNGHTPSIEYIDLEFNICDLFYQGKINPSSFLLEDYIEFLKSTLQKNFEAPEAITASWLARHPSVDAIKTDSSWRRRKEELVSSLHPELTHLVITIINHSYRSIIGQVEDSCKSRLEPGKYLLPLLLAAQKKHITPRPFQHSRLTSFRHLQKTLDGDLGSLPKAMTWHATEEGYDFWEEEYRSGTLSKAAKLSLAAIKKAVQQPGTIEVHDDDGASPYPEALQVAKPLEIINFEFLRNYINDGKFCHLHTAFLFRPTPQGYDYWIRLLHSATDLSDHAHRAYIYYCYLLTFYMSRCLHADTQLPFFPAISAFPALSTLPQVDDEAIWTAELRRAAEEGPNRINFMMDPAVFQDSYSFDYDCGFGWSQTPLPGPRGHGWSKLIGQSLPAGYRWWLLALYAVSGPTQPLASPDDYFKFPPIPPWR